MERGASRAAAPASAQDDAQQRRTIAQQQKLILQQQKQILENQRQLAAQQQQQLSAPGTSAAPPANLNRGLLGNIGGCPPGYTYNLFQGCLPTVVVIH